MITGPKMREVTLDDLLEMVPNSRQRNTKMRAARALKGHLAKPAPTHYLLASVKCKGFIHFVDGHTRLELWSTGKLKLPKHPLVLQEWKCDHLSEVGELYALYDNQAASKKAPDRLYGVCHEQGLVFESDLMLRGGVSTALSLIAGTFGAKFDEGISVSEWKNELLEVDSWDLRRNHIPSMVLAAALVSIRCFGCDVKTFFVGVAYKKGRYQNGRSDGIEALSRLLERRRLQKTLTGKDNLCDVAGKAMACVQFWADGRRFNGGVRGLNWNKLVSQYR